MQREGLKVRARIPIFPSLQSGEGLLEVVGRAWLDKGERVEADSAKAKEKKIAQMILALQSLRPRGEGSSLDAVRLSPSQVADSGVWT